MSKCQDKGLHLTVFSLLPHGPRPAPGYIPLQYRSLQKGLNEIASPANTVCPPAQILGRWSMNWVRRRIGGDLGTYWANGGNHITKANVSLLSPYTAEPPSDSLLLFFL